MMRIIAICWVFWTATTVCAAEPSTPAELIERGETALAKNDDDAALKDFVAALRADPKNVRALRGRAAIAMHRQLYPQAVAGLNEVIAAEPEVAANYALRAAAYAGDRQFDKAIDDWSAAWKRDDKRPEYRVGRGEAHRDAGHADEGLTDFVEVVRAFPRYLPAYLDLGDMLLHVKHDLSRSVGIFGEAIELDAKCATAYLGRGDAFVQDAQYAQALGDLTKAIELDPTSAEAYSLRGDVHLVQGAYPAAVADYRKALELQPTKAIFYCDLGVAQVRNDEIDAALKSLSRAVRLDPQMSRGFVYLAVAQMSQDKRGDAEKSLARAAELDERWKGAKLQRFTSRHIAFANNTDQPVKVKVWYDTDVVDGTFRWFPGEPGQSEPIVHAIAPHDTLYPAFMEKRLPVAKLRFTVEADDGSFKIDEYRERDLEVAPKSGYVDTDFQVFSFPILPKPK